MDLYLKFDLQRQREDFGNDSRLKCLPPCLPNRYLQKLFEKHVPAHIELVEHLPWGEILTTNVGAQKRSYLMKNNTHVQMRPQCSVCT